MLPKEDGEFMLNMNEVRVSENGYGKDLLFRQRQQHFFDQIRSLWTSPNRGLYFVELKRFGSFALGLVITLNLASAVLSGLHLKGAIESQAEMGYSTLMHGVQLTKRQSFAEARSFFQQAENTFQKTSDQLTAMALFSRDQAPLPGSKLRLAQDFAAIGHKISDLAKQYLVHITALKQNIPAQVHAIKHGEAAVKPEHSTSDILGDLHEVMLEGQDTFLRIYSKLDGMLKHPGLPYELKTDLKKAKLYITKLYALNGQGLKAMPTILEMLGSRAPHRYMIVFQNNHEIRATGGFMGSYLLVTMKDGNVGKFVFHDIYDADGQVVSDIKAPEGLNQITEYFSLRDANNEADFPKSAQEIMKFYGMAGGESLDTIVAIDQDFFFDLLAIVGPIDLPGYPIHLNGNEVVINGKQFDTDRDGLSMIFSYIVESHLENSASPKNLLKNLIPILAEKLEKRLTPEQLFTLLNFEISRKQLQAYSRIEEVQSFISSFGFDGTIAKVEAPSDYALIVDTDISGNKSSFSQHVTHNTKVADSGKLHNHLQIYRHHSWDAGNDEILAELLEVLGTKKLEEKRLTEILGKAPYRSYLRIYLPKGISFEKISGIDNLKIEEIDGKTVVAGYPGLLEVDGEQFIDLEYSLALPLPAEYEPTYQFVLQKQAGRRQDTFTKLFSGRNIQITETDPLAFVDPDGNIATVTDEWNRDMVVEVGFEKK